MTRNPRPATTRPMDLLAPSIVSRITDRLRFNDCLARHEAMTDDELVKVVEVCLRNMDRIDETDERTSSDIDLRLVLVPEICDRILPGQRDRLRRISSTLAEYDPDPDQPSPFLRLLSPGLRLQLRESAADLRRRISRAAMRDTPSIVEQVRFSIAGSRSADRWAPSDHVYEPGFTYRVVPVIAVRALERAAQG